MVDHEQKNFRLERIMIYTKTWSGVKDFKAHCINRLRSCRESEIIDEKRQNILLP